MISKKLRVPSSIFLKKPAHRFFSDYLQARISPNNFGYNRLGAAIGIKVDKRSVKRHLLKRTILDAAAAQKNISSDIIIVAKPEIAGLTKEEVKKEVSEIFKKIK
ncbi:MAG TPA: ribonuclease P protein component [Candidatus Paceibacterota bacterium]|nr:ribonuclease P protein component [Candidatus Paceibacterota bacterium]